MTEDLFTRREEAIFKTLKELRDHELVIIGGYAVNAYTLPRFSVDCDIVIPDEEELKRVEITLFGAGYNKKDLSGEAQYTGNFARYEKKLGENIAVSLDVLVGKVTDRMTGAIFTADWIFKNSAVIVLKGKTIIEELRLRIISIDALVVMKMVSCRSTDIRDVFMMLPSARNREWIRSEIQARLDFHDRIKRIIQTVSSPQFKDGLSGVYGFVDQKIFDRHKLEILRFSER